MKSTPSQLESRGYLSDEDFRNYSDRKDIDNLIKSRFPIERTAGVRLIALNGEKRYLEVLCSLLAAEKKLYTKIEICDSLVKYGEDAVPYLFPLLGRIGSNRHKEIANIDLNKKSYPLPRDIAARVLVRIGPAVLKAIEALDPAGQEIDISELIDVIGHITFYSRDYRCEKMLLKLYSENQENEIIKWKIIRAFQSFNSGDVTRILKDVANGSESEILAREGERSLNRIKERSA